MHIHDCGAYIPYIRLAWRDEARGKRPVIRAPLLKFDVWRSSFSYAALFIAGTDEMRLRGLSEPIVRGLKTDV